MKSLKKAKLKGKKVLVRLDLDVPMKNGRVADDTRLVEALPTLRLLKKAKQVIIIGHLGRPKGKDKNFSLKPVARKLSKLLKVKIGFDDLNEKFVMLENLRFEDGEKKNSSTFAKQFTKLADIYVNDAFSDSHRKHASMVAMAKQLPAYPGLKVESEVKQISKIMKLDRPVILVLGGKKIDKLEILEKLVKKVDAVLVGGAMMFTFLKALNYETGKSIVEKDKIKLAKKIMSKKIILPIDVVLDNKKNVYVEKMPKNRAGYDIGKETQAIFQEILANAHTIIWNGPMGFIEKGFMKGTKVISQAMVCSKGRTLAGGGDTVGAVKKDVKKYTHYSTAGGAFLEFISGKKLPGLEVLR